MKIHTNLSLQNIENETWEDVDGWEGKYQVSNLGRFKSLGRFKQIGARGLKMMPSKILRQNTSKGYLTIIFYKNDDFRQKRQSHSVVAERFIPNPENKPQVNHKNGIKWDNRVENLEWATASENQRHALINGLRAKAQGENSNLSKLTNDDIYKIRELYLTKKYRQCDLAKMFSMDLHSISNILLAKGWKHLGIKPISIGRDERIGGRAKLNENDVRVVRHLHYINKMRHEDIGVIFSVSNVAISNIIKGKTYTSVQ